MASVVLGSLPELLTELLNSDDHPLDWIGLENHRESKQPTLFMREIIL